MQPMGRPKHTQNVPCIFSFQVWGGGGFGGGYFSVFPGSHYVDHPTICSLWLGPSREGGGRGEGSSQSGKTASRHPHQFLYSSKKKKIMGTKLPTK
jgi:hypothetical protein